LKEKGEERKKQKHCFPASPHTCKKRIYVTALASLPLQTHGKNVIITYQIKNLYKKTRTSVDNKKSYSKKKDSGSQENPYSILPRFNLANEKITDQTKLQFSFDGNPLRLCLSLHMQHKNHRSTQIFYKINNKTGVDGK
jgi:hypothetical protein